MDGPNLSDPFNREFLEGQYRLWRTDRRAVDESLHYLFSGAEFYGGGTPDFGGGHRSSNGYHAPLTALPVEARLQTAAVRLINAFRMSGHLIARTNPLNPSPKPTPWELDFDRFALTQEDLAKQIDASMFFSISGAETVGAVLDALKETYCGSIGVEYMHIQNLEARTWLAERIEPNHNRPDLPPEKRLRALRLLRRAEQFENFLQVKFLGKKRFGLEGVGSKQLVNTEIELGAVEHRQRGLIAVRNIEIIEARLQCLSKRGSMPVEFALEEQSAIKTEDRRGARRRLRSAWREIVQHIAGVTQAQRRRQFVDTAAHG